MDKTVCARQMNKKSVIPQSPSSNDHSNYKIPRAVATKAKNNEENNDDNIIDYKNISLTMTGEISSGYIHRNSLTQKQPNITFIEDTEDDDEQFISNMKMIIDKNYKMQNKENFSITDLQSKSYLSRKKKCAFSDEDQNLIKRFKKSVDESKASCISSQKLQQSNCEHVVFAGNHSSTICTPQITPIVKDDNMNFSFKNAERSYDQWITPECAKTVTEIEIEQLIYHEMQFFAPPQKDDV